MDGVASDLDLSQLSATQLATMMATIKKVANEKKKEEKALSKAEKEKAEMEAKILPLAEDYLRTDDEDCEGCYQMSKEELIAFSLKVLQLNRRKTPSKSVKGDAPNHKSKKVLGKGQYPTEDYDLSRCGARVFTLDRKWGTQCSCETSSGLCEKHQKQYDQEGNHLLRCGWWGVTGTQKDPANNIEGFTDAHRKWSLPRPMNNRDKFEDNRPEEVKESHPIRDEEEEQDGEEEEEEEVASSSEEESEEEGEEEGEASE